jgi:urease accessory protein
MRRAIIVLPAGTWSEAEPIATATLPFDQRNRRRIRMCDDAGEPFLLDLDRPTMLADGDGLGLAGGGVIRVRAAEEDVIEARGVITADAARLAWHLGNRHTPVQILPEGALRMLDDPVLAAMLAGLGAAVVHCQAPFTPEVGAYAHAHRLPSADDPSPAQTLHPAHEH